MRTIAVLAAAVISTVALAANITLVPDCGLELSRWRTNHPEWLEGACPLTLSVRGIKNERSGVLLLFGDMETAGGSYRSTLLRSSDRGATWEEVMSPVVASSVVALSFVDDDTGYALVGWEVEGPGELWIHRTPDAGETWFPVAEIGKPHPLDLPIRFDCPTPNGCTLSLECANTGRSHHLATADGGRTWHSRGSKGRPARRPHLGGWVPLVVTEAGQSLLLHSSEGVDSPAVLPRLFLRRPDGILERCTSPAAER